MSRTIWEPVAAALIIVVVIALVAVTVSERRAAVLDVPQDCQRHVTTIPARGGWPAQTVTTTTCTAVRP